MTGLSTWPANPLPIKSELFVNGTWNDITDRIRLENEITISGKGRINEKSRRGTCQADFTINNADGLFSNENPYSAYYGKLTGYVPFRTSVTEPDAFAIIPSGSMLRTTDKAALDVTGDLDLRVEFDLDEWTGRDTGMLLMSKYDGITNQRSWVGWIDRYGYVYFRFSTDGTLANSFTANSSAPVDMSDGPGRIALKVTLDVNNGAAGCDVKFYAGTSLALADYVQLGTTYTFAGTKSVFASTANINLGLVNNGAASFSEAANFVGRYYGFEMFNGIGGTEVAFANVLPQTDGATSWADAFGNTWTVENSAAITHDNYRFYGEISKFPQFWDVSGNDVYVPTTASDITQRLTQGELETVSSLTRFFSGFTLQGQWPMEDGSESIVAENRVSNTIPGRTGDVTFGEESDLPASKGAITIPNVGSFVYMRTAYATASGSWFINIAFKFPAVPAGSCTLFNAYVSGSTKLARVNVSVTNTTYDTAVYDSEENLVGSVGTLFGGEASPNQWVFMRLQVQNSGSNVQVDLGWYAQNSNFIYGAGALIVNSTTSGRAWDIRCIGSTNNAGMKLSQIAYGQFVLDNTTQAYLTAANAFNGEKTANRFARVMTENGLAYRIAGSTVHCEEMGPQRPGTLLEIIDQCSDLEDAAIYPDRSSLALVFRTRRSQQNQYGPTMDYTAQELSGELRPIVDPTLFKNRVTVSRPFGSSRTAEKESGPLSTQPYPNGVGVAPDSLTLNAHEDARLFSLASYEVAKGTVTAQRFPTVQVNLERANYNGTSAKLARALRLAKLDAGDLLSLDNLPLWCSPLLADLLIRGYEEVLANRRWQFRWSTSPYSPYRVNDLSNEANVHTRLAATNSSLNANITSSATSFDVKTPVGAKWRTSASRPTQFPILIYVGGEVMSVGAIGAYAAGVQNFSSVTRSIDGIVLAHSVDDVVQVFEPIVIGI